jgi:RNA polymerase sigma-70 factor (ECF subfamily)
VSGRNSAQHFPLTPGAGNSEVRVAGADAQSFLALYYRYFDFVWSSVKYLGIGPDAIDDVVQEVFMVIHARLHTRQKPDALRSWIYGIVRRTASTHRRSSRARTGLETRWEQSHVVTSATPLQLAERSEQVELLAAILAELDEAKREVFVAAELEEMTVPEIADAIEIPLNTAYSRLRAARLAFEERLERRTGRTGPEKGDPSR